MFFFKERASIASPLDRALSHDEKRSLEFMRVLTLLSVLSLTTTLQAEVPLSVGPRAQIQVKAGPKGVFDLTLEAGNPHFWTTVVPKTFDPKKHTIFAFEYFAPTGVESVRLMYRSEDGMKRAGSGEMPLAETWQPVAIDFSEVPEPPAASSPDMRFHLTFGGQPGTTFQIRNLHLREPNAEDRRIAAERDQVRNERNADSEAYRAYLRADYPATIDTVHVGVRDITLIGTTFESAKLYGYPAHLPSHRTPVPKSPIAKVEPNDQGSFRIVVPRFASPGAQDRALWRWRLADDRGTFLTPCRWPTIEGPAVGRRTLEKLTAPHPKGLGGMPTVASAEHEIFDLGIHHATMNFVLTSVLQTAPRRGTKPWMFEGRTYHVNEAAMRGRDLTVKTLSDQDIIVTCILLVGNHRDANGQPQSLLTHPEAESRGTYSIPNLTTPESTAHYRATMHYLTERYSRADGAHGRISNWVLHNEVDQAGTWTNMGDQPIPRYLETYMRSARIVHHSARNFDPHARVFMSLTHHWTKQSSGPGTYVVRDMIDLFAEIAQAEGDFEWGVAYHPYPRDLRNPDTWNDANVTSDFDTPYITPKNLEVLPAYLAQPPFLFRDKPRGILLSEQGFNTPTLNIEDQKRQVAGLIYVFRKLAKLPAIEAYHLHRYQDMPDREGGLRLGIITETGEHKLGWDAYKAIGTPAVAEFESLADEVIEASKD